MDLIQKITHTAAFVQEFFKGVGLGGWVGAEIYQPDNLPIWMKSAARYGRFPLGDIQVTLIIPDRKLELRQIANLHKIFSRMGSVPALILADDLPPKARGVLVRMGVPHVITGGAIYAPQLGLAYGKIKELPAERVSAEALSPVGLKLIAAYLLRPELFAGTPPLSELRERLKKNGYPISVPTLSRAFQQLHALELIDINGQGPNKRTQFMEREATWTRLLEVPVETVVRRLETRHIPPKVQEYVLSGESALSKHSDLMEPKAPTFAMSVSNYRRWKESRSEEKKQAVTDWSAPPATIELWREAPTFLSEDQCLNSVELTLSLRDNPDERIQIALAEVLDRHGLSTTGLVRHNRGAAHG